MTHQRPQYPNDQVLQVSIRNGLTVFRYYRDDEFQTIRSSNGLNTNLDSIPNNIKEVNIASQDNIRWSNSFIRSFDIESLSIIGGIVDNLVELPPLVYLTLRGNSLDEIPSLPFGLSYLDVSDNKIDNIYTSNNNKVETLVINNNLLTEVIDLLDSFPALLILSAMDNMISQIDQDIGSLNGVDLSGNRLTYNSFYNDMGEAFIYDADEDLSGPDGNWYIFNNNPIYRFPEYLTNINISYGSMEFTSQGRLTIRSVSEIISDSLNVDRLSVSDEDHMIILEFHDIGEF